MKRNRFVVLGLTAALLIASLCGCGKKETDSASAATGAAAAAGENTAENTAGDAAANTSENAAADESVSADSAGPDSEWPESIKPGDSFPDFTATLSDGSEFCLSEELKDHKAVLINIWAIYCGPCRKEFPDINAVYKTNADDVSFVCLSCNADDTMEAIEEYKEEMGLDLPMGKDSPGIYRLIGTGRYPTTILIDRYGKYVYCGTGAFPGADSIQRLLDAVTGDDCTHSAVIEELPPVKPDAAAMSDEDLSAAVCADGTLRFTTPTEDAYCWPFVKASEGVVNANACADPSGYEDGVCAEMDTCIEAAAGEVFAFDYSADTMEPENGLMVLVNDKAVRFIGGEEEGTYAYEFPEDGSYQVRLVYRTHGLVENTADTITIKNATLAEGEAAKTLLAGMKTFPQTLDGMDISMDFDHVKEITFIDKDNAVVNRFGDDVKFYVADAPYVDVHLCLGKDADPYYAVLSNSADDSNLVLARCDTDETGFNCTEKLISVEEVGCSYNYFAEMSVYGENYGTSGILFVNEENVNYFVKNDVLDGNNEPVAGITWQYADGTMPSTDKIAEVSAAAANSSAVYTIHIVDENGDPVDGCIVNVCTDVSCNPSVAAGGELTFTNDAYPYSIHIIKYPDGYTFDTGKEFIMPEEGGELTITVPHAE